MLTQITAKCCLLLPINTNSNKTVKLPSPCYFQKQSHRVLLTRLPYIHWAVLLKLQDSHYFIKIYEDYCYCFLQLHLRCPCSNWKYSSDPLAFWMRAPLSKRGSLCGWPLSGQMMRGRLPAIRKACHNYLSPKSLVISSTPPQKALELMQRNLSLAAEYGITGEGRGGNGKGRR